MTWRRLPPFSRETAIKDISIRGTWGVRAWKELIECANETDNGKKKEKRTKKKKRKRGGGGFNEMHEKAQRNRLTMLLPSGVTVIVEGARGCS